MSALHKDNRVVFNLYSRKEAKEVKARPHHGDHKSITSCAIEKVMVEHHQTIVELAKV